MTTTLLYNIVCIYLLWAVFMTSYQISCNGIVIENTLNSNDDNTARPETTTPQGIIRGMNMVTRHNKTVFGFVGIPYAQPPIGNLRFKAPKPAGGWDGILDASNGTDPIVCPQFDDENILVGDEDCLYLHVYTPKLRSTQNSTSLPVMFYIIGGGFKTEKNSPFGFGPQYLLDEDVILVVPNYRVGVLGFLSTADEVSPGNYGMKDMVQALKWTHDNIQYFGGDPNRVTLFGGSSGSACVELLALSISTKGLFHKIITQSGSALSPNFKLPRKIYAERATKLGEYLGCPTNTSSLLVNCLRNVSVFELVDSNSLFYAWNTFPILIWIPIFEPDIEGAFIIDSPANLIASGKMPDIPWLSMITWDEGLATAIRFYEDPELLEEFFQNIDSILPSMFDYKDVVDNETAYTVALKSFYLNDLTANKTILLANLTHMIGDALFAYPAYSAMQRQSRLAKSSLYFGVFKYRGTFSYSYRLSGGSTEYTGVSHGDEIIYLFRNFYSRFGPAGFENTETDWKMVDTMVQLWTSFAINGTPTTVDQKSIWEPYSARNNYLRIGNGSHTTLEMENNFNLERMQFWDKLTAASSGAFRNSLQALSSTICFCLVSYM